jgi:hypothetical protein
MPKKSVTKNKADSDNDSTDYQALFPSSDYNDSSIEERNSASHLQEQHQKKQQHS